MIFKTRKKIYIYIFHFRWLQSRKNDDNAEELWRIHDKLYDLTDFVNRHPGGRDWITLTKVCLCFKKKNTARNIHIFFIIDIYQGTDITEAFEIHHLNRFKVEKLLSELYVREAKLPRNFKFTFKETGFYRTLQRRVLDELNHIDHRQDEFLSKVSIKINIFRKKKPICSRKPIFFFKNSHHH